MAESNATQVILTDDGIKIIKAQNTADNATGGVTDLNDPNLMSVIEKQTQASQYAGLTSQYNVILKRAKDASISTTDLTTAYTNLNTFMAAILTDTTKASDVNRDTYKSLMDAYNTTLSNVQTALSNSFNADIDNMQSSVSVASQAASSAVIVASQAAITGDNASQVASQAVVVANQAKSAGDNATSVANNASQAASNAILVGSTATVNANKALTAASQAQTAGNNAISVANNASQAASSAILAGSTAAVTADKAITAASQAQSAGDNATSVANNASQAASSAILAGSTASVTANKASADYQTLSAGVKDGSVVHITTETVIDKGVIGTAEIANGAITNAQIGNAAISSAKIAELAVGTAQIGDGAITNAKIGKLAVGTAQIADGAITNVQIGNEAVGTAQIADLAVNSAKIASLAVGTAQIGDGAITNAKIGKLAVGTAQIADGAITDAQIGSLAVGTAQIKDGAINSAKIASLAVGTAQIGDGAITNAKIANLAVGTAQIANAAITDAQVGNVSANKLTAGTIDFNTITGTNINASNITTGILNTDRLNVNKLSALSADLGDVTTGSLKGVDIVAKTFSTPNGSFTTDANGAITAKNMTLIGGTLTSPIINASTINGSTINGTTFNAGSQLNSYGNTGYPLTIYPDGSLSSTTFRTISVGTDAQRASIKDGIFKTNLRGMTSLDNGKYLAADAILQSGQLALYQGYSDSRDANFTNTSLHATGYVIVDSTNGITLHGDDQWIRFNGYANDSNPQGIVMTPWGNINPQGGQSDWYVGNKNTDKTAQFGIDADHKVTINLFRPTFVDEIGAMGNRLTNGRLLLHDVAGTAQLYLLHDDAPAVVSPTIYNRTYSTGSNMYVTSSGRVGRTTSASKYKLAIARSDDTSQADRLMTLNLASWNDKVATEKMAKSLSNGEIPVEPEINLKRHYGLIAEDLRDAGLDEFLITGKDGQIEGIEYDRLWTVLIPKIKQLNNRINELERKTL
ncbi:beta strand repeat-containing protein [Lactiplantibacillus plantarum]